VSHTRRLVRLRERIGGTGPGWVLAAALLIGLLVEAVHQLLARMHRPTELMIDKARAGSEQFRNRDWA
jgi:hypothetical protein